MHPTRKQATDLTPVLQPTEAHRDHARAILAREPDRHLRMVCALTYASESLKTALALPNDVVGRDALARVVAMLLEFDALQQQPSIAGR